MMATTCASICDCVCMC